MGKKNPINIYRSENHKSWWIRGERSLLDWRVACQGGIVAEEFCNVIEIIMSEKIWMFGRGILIRGNNMYKWNRDYQSLLYAVRINIFHEAFALVLHMYIQDLDEHEFLALMVLWVQNHLRNTSFGLWIGNRSWRAECTGLKREVCIVRTISLTIVSLGIFDEGWGIS